MADPVNDTRPRPEKTVPQPARRVDGEAAGEADGKGGERLSPPAPDRPVSVRETMPSARRYDSGGGRRASVRRQRKHGPARGAPPSARELTNPGAVEVPTRQVELGDEVWTVIVKGSGTIGSGGGGAARLLNVGLEAPGESPYPGGTRYLAAGRLDEVDEEVLRALVVEVKRNPDVATGLSPRRRRPRDRRRKR